MSKLFRNIQEAEKHSVERPAGSAAVAELLAEIGAEVEVGRKASSAPLSKCETIQLPDLHRPVLLAADENVATHSAFESYRSLRTKLTHAQSAQGVRSVVVSSSIPGEGKTVSALNLALSLAQLETQRVLLVDGDIRTAGLSGILGVADQAGLADVLSGHAKFTDVVCSTNIPRFYIVGAGQLAGPAADLFTGSKWADFVGCGNELFDMVVVDSPPILGLADFELISAGCDGILIVVRARKTKRDILAEISQHLEGKAVLGVILNGQKQQSRRYGYYYYGRSTRRPRT
jgi:capsular exopolysaccharide synthesis family protein